MSSTPPRAAGDRPLGFRLPLAALLLAAGALALVRLADRDLVERLYARGIFPPLRVGLSTVAGVLPVSLAELGIAALVLLALLRLTLGLRSLAGGRRSAGNLLGHCVRQVLVAACLAYALFVAAWGLNHRRPPLADLLALPVRESDTDELAALWRELLDEALAARARLEEDGEGVVAPGTPRAELWRRLGRAFDRAAAGDPVLEGGAPLVRVALASPLLTAARITGIYSPFTGEAHVNGMPPDFTLPFTALHELAHARGFAREDEANYLAARVGRASGDPELVHSAALMSLLHVRPLLAGQLLLEQGHEAAAAGVAWPPELARDVARLEAFWRRETSAVQRVTTRVAQAANDTYLRSQGDGRGTRSYGAMVDLLLAERRTR